MKRLLLIAAAMAIACASTASAFLFQFNFNNFCGQPCARVERFGILSSARTLAFGTHSTGTTTRRTITLYNTGTAAINDLSQGTYSSAVFSAATSATNPCGAVLAAKSNCNMDVRFTPAAAQSYSATAVVLSNQLENYMFTVTGTGVASLLVNDDFSTNTVANYTKISGNTISVASGAAHGYPNATTVVYSNTSMSSNDHWVKGDIVTGQYDYSALILGSNSSQYYLVRIVNGTLYLRDSVTGNFSRTYAGGYINGSSYTIKAQIDTSSGHARFNVWVNDILVLANQIDTADTVTRGPYIGMYFHRDTSNADAIVDNLQGSNGLAP